MVPHSMNGAYSDRGSHEYFAIRLPIQSERVNHRSIDAQNSQCRR